MSILVVDQIKHIGREMGFSWNKVLRLAVLGAVLGLFLALVIPVRVS